MGVRGFISIGWDVRTRNRIHGGVGRSGCQTLVYIAGNKSTNRGRGKPDINVLAYEKMLVASGQIEKPEPPPV
jgi:hypothetical protein